MTLSQKKKKKNEVEKKTRKRRGGKKKRGKRVGSILRQRGRTHDLTLCVQI